MTRIRTLIFTALATTTALTLCTGFARRDHHTFNEPGNVLIADQFNNRVIEVEVNGNIVWSFGDGSPTPGPTSIGAPNDSERVGPFTLMSGTGTSSVADNRVVFVDPFGAIVWQYGQGGVTGSGPDQLNAPVCSVYLPDGDVLITDQGNQRIIEVTLAKRIVWQYGTTGVAGDAPNQLNNPNSAELLPNGHILIADENNNRVIEVKRNGHIVWSYGNPSDTTILNQTAFASRLSNGDTLISDSGNNRIVEVNQGGAVVWAYYTNTRLGSVANPAPTRAVRLRDGLTVISDQFNNQVIAVDHGGNVVWSYGQIGVVGNGPNQLNAPYDAKVIGDYTGLTPPF